MRWIAVGKILGPHGLKGLLKALFFSGSAVETPSPVALRGPSGRIEWFEAVDARPNKKTVLLSLQEINSRESAQSLKGWEIIARRSDLPDPGPGSYYWADLMGMDVFREDGRLLGKLSSIIETGSADVYVIRTPSGENAEKNAGEILIPALESIVLKVDETNKKMTVKLPPGLDPDVSGRE
ncbi:Ribosome maturation factor RimM [Candidatus Desulfarcum epimagneticum]|uniref:Ribosome maturation factor RimM n=1 Tax=uncultured Desulfobacteraceae bacterium TaxID=218296 RepID=A0A484HFB6_9BACT|nr:Ribosome maturation factor RimM [uncultured Desulfobacteraceae bacterium]